MCAINWLKKINIIYTNLLKKQIKILKSMRLKV